jgi:hypothetical protein
VIGEEVSARLPLLRAQAESLMQDACTITRTTAGTTFNETTGQYDAGSTSTLYTGKCRVKPRDNADRVVQFGERAVSFWPYIVSVPMSVTTVELNDVITITASALDASLVGLKLRVREVLAGSHLTARRLSCEVDAS